MTKLINRFLTLILFFVLALPIGAHPLVKPLAGITILLDPGHGGADPGAMGPTNLKESEVNLRVARYLRYLLEADGAEVHMTRTTDKTLSLGERVGVALQLKPDLFLSIHHNSSLSKVLENRAEFYYAAQDYGLSKRLASAMSSEFKKQGFGNSSVYIPGGYYLLRNTPGPAIISEGAYISHGETEKSMMTGKFLTNQAQALRTAIKQVFPKELIRANIYSDSKIELECAYFNLLMYSDKPLLKVNARLTPQIGAFDLAFEPVMKWTNTHKIYNKTPLHSGIFDLSLMFFSTENAVSHKHNLQLEVKLPVNEVRVSPVATYIPTGFKGRFPVMVTLTDYLDRPNTRAARLQMRVQTPAVNHINTLIKAIGELSSMQLPRLFEIERLLEGEANSKGVAMLYLELTGNERDFVTVQAVCEGVESSLVHIPVLEAEKTFVLGRLDGIKGPIENQEIIYDGSKKTVTLPFGYFFFESGARDLNIAIEPNQSYESLYYGVDNIAVPVHLPVLQLKPLASGLLGLGLGAYFADGFCEASTAKQFVGRLEQMGAQVFTLESRRRPQQGNKLYQAVLNANLQKDLSLLLSFKKERVKAPQLRHYHRAGSGSKLAKHISQKIKENGGRVDVRPGGDYEINNSSATALVVALPEGYTEAEVAEFMARLFEALKTI
jgi:N-acetylmuramoyl-L-alanine amidase